MKEKLCKWYTCGAFFMYSFIFCYKNEELFKLLSYFCDLILLKDKE